jgi:hypothetical protein
MLSKVLILVVMAFMPCDCCCALFSLMSCLLHGSAPERLHESLSATPCGQTVHMLTAISTEHLRVRVSATEAATIVERG